MSRILMVASEATPFSKTGGLADVIGALPAALKAQGEDVAVVLPFYRESAGFLEGAERVYNDLYVWLGLKSYQTHIRKIERTGVLFYFVDCPALFDREFLYGPPGGDYPDNHIRFAVFSQAVLGVIRYLFRPQVIHCHDWQSALVAPVIRCQYPGDPTFYGMKLLLTIHNLGYQGIFPRDALAEMGLNASLFHPDRLEFWGKINLLKGGIAYSDAISTVSKGYAREIQEPELGFGLDGLLRSRADVLTGIVNGADYSEWSPESDRFICERFNSRDLSGKRVCKRDLLESFGLPAGNLDRPLVGIVSRFVSQKGFDLIQEIAPELAKEDLSLVALGSGEAQYERTFLDLAAAHPGRISVKIAYDNALAHKIEAGSDIFLMPSRYEPCGLSQIYSLSYGTIPVVRATGGLDDTIDDETGFKFREYSGTALLRAVRDALAAYRNKKQWERMMRKAMAKDFSWDASAAEYSALYKRLTG